MDHAIIDLAVAAVIFGVCTLPGLVLLRRRLSGRPLKS
jgi:hypothetical protein